MSRQSFRLRRSSGAGDAIGVGSFVRGTSDIQRLAGASVVDQDSALRSTGIITVTQTSDLSYFFASAIEYNAVLLNWTLTEEFVDVATIGIGDSGLIGIAIVYSDVGYPETVADGKVIVQGAVNTYLHQAQITINTDAGVTYISEPEPGRWAYYTLFGYYNTDGVDGSFFYERLTSLEVIVPYDYGSRSDMWNRIPLYYRLADTDTAYLDPSSLNRGQLERYIDVFGFEVDRMKTIIDSSMVQYDPILADANAIAELSSMLGLEVDRNDIGIGRVRALLHDIGAIRRQKGTINATKAYVTAVSGGNVSVFTGASAPYFTFAVHAQRANLIANPQFVGNTSWNVTSQYGVTTVGASHGITITAGATPTKVAIRSTVGVPVDADTVYYTSSSTTGASAPLHTYGGLWHTSASWNDWGSVTADVTELAAGISGRSYFEMADTATTGTKYPVFVIGLAANQSITFKYWMVEPNKYGDFFDGDSVFGGFLYQGFASDFKWAGTKYASYSIYTTNRKKTQTAITQLLPQILPVTLMGTSGGINKYATQFDWIPGKTL